MNILFITFLHNKYILLLILLNLLKIPKIKVSVIQIYHI